MLDGCNTGHMPARRRTRRDSRSSPPRVNVALRDGLLELVDKQLAANNPPAMRLALERLMREGMARDQARLYIAMAILMAADGILRTDSAFDEAAFADLLDRLPHLAWPS